MEIHFNLYNFLSLLGVSNGFILGFILLFNQKRNKQASRFLAALIISFALTNGKYLAIDLGVNHFFPQIWKAPFAVFLLLGPLLYFYVSAYTVRKFKLQAKHRYHFLPAIIFFIWGVLDLSLPVTLQKQFHELGRSLHINSIQQVGGILSLFIYGALSMARIRRYQNWLDEQFSSHEKLSLKWLWYLLLSLMIGWLLFLVHTCIDFLFYDFGLPPSAYYPLILYISVLLYWIGYKGLYAHIIPENAKIQETPVQIANTHKNQMPIESKKDFSKQINQLEQVMQTQKPYLDTDLNLVKLAEVTNVSSKTLSNLLNQGLNKTFHQYINSYRVEEVKQKLLSSQHEHLTLLGIAEEAGFNSKSTFNAIFKKYTGMTPREYRKQAKQASKASVIP